MTSRKKNYGNRCLTVVMFRKWPCGKAKLTMFLQFKTFHYEE